MFLVALTFAVSPKNDSIMTAPSPCYQTSMSARFVQYAVVAGKQVPIYIAQEVQHAGYKRVIDAIDTNILNDTVEIAKAAAEGNKHLSETQKDSTSFITITYVNI